MNNTILLCLLILLASTNVRASKVGDVAVGKIVSETDTALTLQIKPCSTNPETMMFPAPWKKRFVGAKKCPNGQKYDEYQVEQVSQFSHSTAAKSGDVANGLVDQQTDNSVTLNTTPCEDREKVQFLVFESPYRIRDSGEGTCPNGKKYKKSSVEQLTSSVSADRPDWQAHIDWAAASVDAAGDTNCPDQYVEMNQAACIANSGRACVVARATEAAKEGNCEMALRLILLTQCHNESARQALASAGAQPVCTYLKTK